MLNKQDQYKKEAIRLMKRLNDLYEEMRNQPFIEVPPFQRGWLSSIVLREDIANRKDADFIRHLIDIGYQKTKHIRKLEHVKLIKKGIYRYDYKWRDHVHTENFIPDVIKLSEKQYQSLSEKEKKFFRREYDSYARFPGYHINISNYWIKLEVKPNMFDRIMDKNGELESEYARIRTKLENPPYAKYFYRYKSGWDHRPDESKLGKMLLKEGLNEVNDNEYS